MIIKIKYTDGTEELVSTLRQLCKTKVGGGYTLGYGEDMQRGKFEELDAREALCGFSDPEFDDSDWEIAGEEHPIIDLAPLFIRPQYCVTKIGERLRPVSVRVSAVRMSGGTPLSAAARTACEALSRFAQEKSSQRQPDRCFSRTITMRPALAYPVMSGEPGARPSGAARGRFPTARCRSSEPAKAASAHS